MRCRRGSVVHTIATDLAYSKQASACWITGLMGMRCYFASLSRQASLQALDTLVLNHAAQLGPADIGAVLAARGQPEP